MANSKPSKSVACEFCGSVFDSEQKNRFEYRRYCETCTKKKVWYRNWGTEFKKGVTKSK